MSRGILYLVWGTGYEASLHRSIASIQHWHPELPFHVEEMPANSTLLCKSRMYELSPYDETLFLDADTTVMGDLDYGFDRAYQFGIACCISANPWQRRYYKLAGHPDAVEYSSGVVFFSKGERTGDVFDAWQELSDGSVDSRCRYQAEDGIKEQLTNDQALFTLALQRCGFNPFVLPLNWNLFPKWQKHFFGNVKIFHGCDDIPEALPGWNEQQQSPGAAIRCVALP